MNSARVLCVDKRYMTLKHLIMNALICLINDLISLSGNVDCTMLIMVGHQAAQTPLANQGALVLRKVTVKESQRKIINKIPADLLRRDLHVRYESSLTSGKDVEINYRKVYYSCCGSCFSKFVKYIFYKARETILTEFPMERHAKY